MSLHIPDRRNDIPDQMLESLKALGASDDDIDSMLRSTHVLSLQMAAADQVRTHYDVGDLSSEEMEMIVFQPPLLQDTPQCMYEEHVHELAHRVEKHGFEEARLEIPTLPEILSALRGVISAVKPGHDLHRTALCLFDVLVGDKAEDLSEDSVFQAFTEQARPSDGYEIRVIERTIDEVRRSLLNENAVYRSASDVRAAQRQ
jgi:hypothetical protein